MLDGPPTINRFLQAHGPIIMDIEVHDVKLRRRINWARVVDWLVCAWIAVAFTAIVLAVLALGR